MIFKLFKTTNKALECSQKQRKYLIEEYRKTLEQCIYSINQVQDISSIQNKTEAEKDTLRNNIIDNTRIKFLTKLIELDNLSKKI